MWVTQTYLGRPDPDAKLFVYYLWEEYKEQEDVPKEIICKLASAGRAFGEDVSLFAPIPGAQHEIRSELRSQRYDFFWHEISQNTPGLLLTTKPLADLEPRVDKDEYRFFPLPRKRATEYGKTLETVFASLHKACVQKLENEDKRNNDSLLDKLWNSVLLEPNFFGIGMDFKPIISWVLQKRKDREGVR